MSIRFVAILAAAMSLLGWVAACVLCLVDVPSEWFYVFEGLTVVAVMCMVLFYHRLVRPMHILRGSMDMLRGRDWNNRLLATGQPEADTVIDVFNRMFDMLSDNRQQLIAQTHKLNLLVDNTSVGVAVFEPDGSVSMANGPAKALLDNPTIAQAARDKGRDTTVRVDAAHVYRVTSRTYVDRGVEHPFCLIENIASELSEAERTGYSKVIRLMAHEVNNSIAPLTASLDVASESVDDPALAELLQSSMRRALDLSEFITRFADVVRLPEPVLERVELSDVVSSNMPFLQSIAAGTRVEVEMAPVCRRVFVDADVVQLGQVLVNGVRNSVQSIGRDKPGRVVIECGRDAATRRPYLAVVDNGPGITPEKLPNIFQPFYTDKPDGQGIGLTLIAEIARRHGAYPTLETGSDGLTRLTLRF